VNDSRSCAFSGVLSPSTADLSILASLERKLGRKLGHPKNLASIEWDKAAQAEILTHPDRPQHLFADIADFFVPEMRPFLASLESGADIDVLEVLGPMIKTKQMVTPHAWCLIHQKMCKHPHAKKHKAGTPCTDWITQGAIICNAGKKKTTNHLVAWVCMRRMINEPEVTQ